MAPLLEISSQVECFISVETNCFYFSSGHVDQPYPRGCFHIGFGFSVTQRCGLSQAAFPLAAPPGKALKGLTPSVERRADESHFQLVLSPLTLTE